jgi:hypothetical protein
MCCVYDITLPIPHPPRPHGPRSQIHTALVIPHLPVPTLLVHKCTPVSSLLHYTLPSLLRVSWTTPSPVPRSRKFYENRNPQNHRSPDRVHVGQCPSTFFIHLRVSLRKVQFNKKMKVRIGTTFIQVGNLTEIQKIPLYVVLSPVLDTVVKHDCEVCVGNSYSFPGWLLWSQQDPRTPLCLLNHVEMYTSNHGLDDYIWNHGLD